MMLDSKKFADRIKAILEENKMLKESAEAEWTPCSERLPSEDEMCLVTIQIDDVRYVHIALFHKGHFCEYKDEWGTICFDDVLAWQPLPIPYKGDDCEGEINE